MSPCVLCFVWACWLLLMNEKQYGVRFCHFLLVSVHHVLISVNLLSGVIVCLLYQCLNISMLTDTFYGWHYIGETTEGARKPKPNLEQREIIYEYLLTVKCGEVYSSYFYAYTSAFLISNQIHVNLQTNSNFPLDHFNINLLLSMSIFWQLMHFVQVLGVRACCCRNEYIARTTWDILIEKFRQPIWWSNAITLNNVN